MIGRTFAGFKILERLGGGNTGVVYRAQDQKGRQLALKILQNDILVSKETRARFMRESQAAIILAHPSISQLYEVGEYHGCNYLAMEYVDGQSLTQLIAENEQGMPAPAFYKLMQPVLDGIAYAHNQGLLHRDIKPDNIKVNSKGKPKVLDFGLVKFLDREEDTDESSFRTMAGMVLGSAAYMSPEQARGEVLNERSDIFSLGIVMYEMLTGKNPFEGVNPFATMTNILNQTPISIELLQPEVPVKLAQVVSRCLNKDAAQRFENGGSLFEAISKTKS